MNKISLCLWYDTQAEEAANFYVSIFKNSKLGKVAYYGKEGQEITGGKPGSVMTVDFELEGQRFIALNGGPHFQFSPAISVTVDCRNQEEVDYFSEKLSAGGEVVNCGWVTDKFGVSWQVVPTVLQELMEDEDSAKRERVMKAMLQMHKLDIAALKKAAQG